MITKEIGMTWIVVKDLEKSIGYYTHTLGFKLLEKSPQWGWAELQGTEGGARLGLAETNDHSTLNPGQNAVFTLSVDNIESARDEAIKGGSTPVGDIQEVPGHMKLLLCKDLDGNHFQFAQKLD